MIRTSTAFRLALVGAAVPAALMLGAGPALAASDVTVSNTETIQAHLDASGKVKDKRVYEQLAFTGQGQVDVSNPVSADGLRNLDGFKNYDVKDGNMVATVDVNGEKRMRTVSNFDKDLPLGVEITYTLDGRGVEPGDVVGKSGVLEVHYKITNKTGKPGTVSFDDGTGTQVTKDAEIAIPMVGSLSTVLPSTFTEVSSNEANMAGDGHGGTKLSFTMTLFAPIGSNTAEFGYKARITDGVVPTASISSLPVNPLESPSFKGGAGSYKSGADTGAQLTGGAIQIDENLLKLRDGSAALLAGLIKLQDGAHKLNDGLANTAAPGAAKLADGANQASAGASRLADGLPAASKGAGDLHAGLGKASEGSGDLSDGLDALSAGTDALAEGFHSSTGGQDLVSGSSDLAAGLEQISGGLTTLAGANGLPKALAGAQQLKYGIDHPVGAGGAADPGGLLQAVQAIGAGLAQVDAGVGQLATGLPTAKGGVDQVKAGLDSALVPNTGGIDQLRGGVGQVKAGLDAALASGGDIDQLAGAIAAAQASGCTGSCQAYLTAALDAVDNGLRDKTTAASGGLGQVSGGLDTLKSQLTAAAGGLGQVSVGLGSAVTGATQLKAGTSQLVAGNASMESAVSGKLIPGLDQLVAGLTAAVGGVTALSTGASSASDGASQLAGSIDDAGVGAELIAAGTATAADGADALYSGVLRLKDGSAQLATGLVVAADGSQQLADGNQQIADGANQLSSGLNDAADGSGQIADGLDTAAGGAPAITKGAQQLSDEGTKVLIVKGKETAQTFGEKYALIDAGAKRAQTESMAYGAPEGATGQTAYTMEIAGADAESDHNWARGLGALAIFAIAGGAAAAIRQRMV